jgi:hypothetical protein
LAGVNCIKQIKSCIREHKNGEAQAKKYGSSFDKEKLSISSVSMELCDNSVSVGEESSPLCKIGGGKRDKCNGEADLCFGELDLEVDVEDTVVEVVGGDEDNGMDGDEED